MSVEAIAGASQKTPLRRSRVPASARLAAIAWPIVRTALLTLASPVLLLLSIRRSMTAASVTLLLFGIVSLNIVWGYPWLGPFSAIVTLLVAGWACNRVLRPRLDYQFTLPNHSPSGEPLEVVIGMHNPSSLPALEMSVGFDAKSSASRWGAKSNAPFEIDASPAAISILRPGDRHSKPVRLVGHGRGWHRLPDVIATSMFPFHLFRSTQRFRPTTEIAITPRPLTGDEDPIARGLMDTLGGWTFRLTGGDALDYTGSREYEVGMPVRRWDFVSWARLGRPIVQEFSAPSVQLVTILVDTSCDQRNPNQVVRSREARLHQAGDDALLERVLSLAATAVNELCRRRVRTRLFVTSESIETFAAARHVTAMTESEPMLIQLASATEATATDSDQRMMDVLEQLGRSPVLLISRRRSLPKSLDGFGNVAFVSVSAPTSTANADGPSSHRFDRAHPNVANMSVQGGSESSASRRGASS